MKQKVTVDGSWQNPFNADLHTLVTYATTNRTYVDKSFKLYNT